MASSLKNKQWNRIYGHTLQSQKIGLLGFGDIGRRVVEKLSGFGCEIYGYDKFVKDEVFKSFGVIRAELDWILNECDIISLHLPLNEETKYIISYEQFKIMKPTAYLINTARGGLINEAALINALLTGEIAGAAVDVYESEPYDKKLIELDNCFCTPHVAGATYQTMDLICKTISKAILDYFSGKRPENIIVSSKYSKDSKI